MTMLFLRPNGERVSLNEIAKIIANYLSQNLHNEYQITVGTDSQNFDKTKIVEVIAVHRVGQGGIFFYRINYTPRIDNLRQKIQEETQRSLDIADNLILMIELSLLDQYNIDLNKINIHFQIHCDVGYNGSTKALIQEIVGWVQAMGYECAIKPDSYAASGIANKFSK